MELGYSILGKDVPIGDMTVPVISPYWRLKCSGDWITLWKYQAEEMVYSTSSHLMGGILSLFNGKLSIRHLAMVLQYVPFMISILLKKPKIVWLL